MRAKSPDRASVSSHRPAWWPLALASMIGLVLPNTTQAHTPIQGLGEIASGLLHPLLTPPHLLVLLALGFLLGQQKPLQLARPVAMFAMAAALGILLTTIVGITGELTPVLMLVVLPVGGLIVLARPLSGEVRLALCTAAAMVLGLDSGVDPGTLAFPAVKTLTATWVSLLLCVVNVAFYVSLLPSFRWVQTGVRIVGSWIVAIALLMLAFALRKG